MPFIVFEGVDGCGKSTQLNLLTQRLETEGFPFTMVRDPGGTDLGERVREILLDPQSNVGPRGELFGYLLSRAQLVHETIAPALAAGSTVISDRFYWSTLAYQSFGLGLDRGQVEAANDLCVAGTHPDLTIWLDVDVEEGARRRAKARGQEDRIEARGLAYLTKVHEGYAALAEEGRITRVDGSRSPGLIAEDIWKKISTII